MFKQSNTTWSTNIPFFKDVDKMRDIYILAGDPLLPLLTYVGLDGKVIAIVMPDYPKQRIAYRKLIRQELLSHDALAYAFISSAWLRRTTTAQLDQGNIGEIEASRESPITYDGVYDVRAHRILRFPNGRIKGIGPLDTSTPNSTVLGSLLDPDADLQMLG